MKYLQGEKSPSGRYTVAYDYVRDDGTSFVAHISGRSYKRCKAFIERNTYILDAGGHIVSYESLPDDHPFKIPNHAYHDEEYA